MEKFEKATGMKFKDFDKTFKNYFLTIIYNYKLNENYQDTLQSFYLHLYNKIHL